MPDAMPADVKAVVAEQFLELLAPSIAEALESVSHDRVGWFIARVTGGLRGRRPWAGEAITDRE